LVVLLAAALAMPQEPQQPLFPSAPTGFVTDAAGVVSDADERQMTRLIEIVQAASGGEIAVVTLPTLQGRDVGDVALQIGRAWGVGAKADIGDRARNAGVVVLLVPRDSDGRGYLSIQTGQGVEGFIPDAVAGDIRREATPALSRLEYGAGLLLITARLAERYAAEFEFALDSTLVPRQRQRDSGIPPFVIIIAVLILISLMSGGGRGGRGRRRRVMMLPFPMGGGFGGGRFGGGGFGGGFGGFGGGGGFSGGGSSGSF
jgi:uncharacterized protein